MVTGERKHLASFGAALLASVLVSALVFSPIFASIRGSGIDLLYWIRHTAGLHPDFGESHVAILAIDEETYRRPPFEAIPNVMWTPQLAGVFQAILDGGASVIGLDVVFPTSIEGFTRNDERPLSGFDRPLLRVLLTGGRNQGRIVLGYVQHQEKPLFPHIGQERIIGGRANIRSLNAFEDPDGIIRRLSLKFDREPGQPQEPSFMLELAARAAKVSADAASGPDPMFGDRPIPTDGNGNLLLHFDTRPGSVPIYSFADLHACAEAGRTDYFRENFADKVVILGLVVDLEDRKFTSKRFANSPDGENLPARCVHPVDTSYYRTDLARDQIPGVLLHATAVNNLIDDTALKVPHPFLGFAITVVTALAAAIAAVFLNPAKSFTALLVGACVWVGIATFAFYSGLVLPFIEALAAAIASFLLLLLFRVAVTDRDRQQIRKAFALYLPTALVDRMASTGRMPALGGETRTVTILFSDLAGFTKLSEGVEPEVLVAWLNDYFGVMTDIIEEHGGFVDKFIGDAILAVFGAPLDDPDHATNGVLAALKMRDVLSDPNGSLAGGVLGTPKCRIGLNSGPVLIGNIGSSRRFNYTVIGDAVNLASRLEGTNKAYGTQILVSSDTVLLCDERVAFRELDTVRVVGRAAPASLFEPIMPSEKFDPEISARHQNYAAGLAAWRAGQFEEAVRRFTTTSAVDGAAASFLKRAKAAAGLPVPANWTGVTDLTEK